MQETEKDRGGQTGETVSYKAHRNTRDVIRSQQPEREEMETMRVEERSGRGRQ